MNAVAANAAVHPAITPLEFMLGMMRDPSVDPALRFKAAQASAMYVHPKPTVVPTDPAEGAKMVIEGMSAEDRARIDARLERCEELNLKNLLGDNLSPDEQAELERLDAWYETVPPHLLGLDEDDIELRRLVAERPAAPPRQRNYDDPGGHRRRFVAGRQVTVERHGPNVDEDE